MRVKPLVSVRGQFLLQRTYSDYVKNGNAFILFELTALIHSCTIFFAASVTRWGQSQLSCATLRCAKSPHMFTFTTDTVERWSCTHIFLRVSLNEVFPNLSLLITSIIIYLQVVILSDPTGLRPFHTFQYRSRDIFHLLYY